MERDLEAEALKALKNIEELRQGMGWFRVALVPLIVVAVVAEALCLVAHNWAGAVGFAVAVVLAYGYRQALTGLEFMLDRYGPTKEKFDEVKAQASQL